MDWEQFQKLIALDQSGDTEKALAGLQQLANSDADPDDRASVLLSVSALQKELRRYEETRKTLAEARSLARPDSSVHPRALLREACIDAMQGSWGSALEKLNTATHKYPRILRDPDHQDLAQELTRWRGMALYNLNRPSEALPLLQEAVAVDYEKATSSYYLGRCAYDLGKLGEAIKCFQSALALGLDPFYQPSAHYVLGLSYHQQGQYTQSIQELKYCLRHDSEAHVPKWKVLSALVSASKALGLVADSEQYSEMLEAATRAQKNAN